MPSERLIGSSTLFSAYRAIQLSNTLTIFDDGRQSGFIVGSIDPDDMRIEEVASDNAHWLMHMRMLIAVLNEFGGWNFVDPQERLRAQRQRQLTCERCLGAGEIETIDQCWVKCPWCR